MDKKNYFLRPKEVNYSDKNISIEKSKKTTKSKINEILSEEKSIIEYEKILIKFFPNKFFSLEIIKKIVFGQSIEEFEKMVKNELVAKVLKHSNLKNLEIVLSLCESKRDFFQICKEINQEVQYVLKNAKQENLNLIMSFCKNLEDFILLCKDDLVILNLVMRDVDELTNMIEKWNCKNVWDFISICNDKRYKI